MFFKPLTTSDVKSYIANLDSNKSVRSDCPPIKYIKLSSSIIAPVITKIFNICIEMGVFPQSLKWAEIVPVFKKGDKTKEGNYRPISLLSPFSKILERHLYNNIYSFVNKHDILHRYQYGF